MQMGPLSSKELAAAQNNSARIGSTYQLRSQRAENTVRPGPQAAPHIPPPFGAVIAAVSHCLVPLLLRW